MLEVPGPPLSQKIGSRAFGLAERIRRTGMEILRDSESAGFSATIAKPSSALNTREATFVVVGFRMT